MTPWLTIVGLGEDGLDGLTPAARSLVDRGVLAPSPEAGLPVEPPNQAGGN